AAAPDAAVQDAVADAEMAGDAAEHAVRLDALLGLAHLEIQLRQRAQQAADTVLRPANVDWEAAAAQVIAAHGVALVLGHVDGRARERVAGQLEGHAGARSRQDHLVALGAANDVLRSILQEQQSKQPHMSPPAITYRLSWAQRR